MAQKEHLNKMEQDTEMFYEDDEFGSRLLISREADQTELEAFFTENLKHLQDDLWIRNELLTS